VAVAFEVVLGAVVGMAGIADVILDVSIKGVAVLLVACGLTWVLRNGSAASRHLVWSMAIVGVLALPAIRAIAPEWRVPGMTLLLPAESTPEPETPPATTGSEMEGTDRAAGTSPPSWTAGSDQEIPRAVAVAESRRDAAPVALQFSQGGSEVPVKQMESVATANEALGWRSWVLLAWLTGALGLSAWIAAGLIRAHWLARSATPIPVGPVADLADDLSEELDLRSPVTLLQSKRSVMPMTWGFRPKILIPHEASEWTDERLKAVLLHELAHVKRCDYQTQLLARVATVLYWFNPLVWVAARRMRVERELACDDRVLNTGSRPSDYASHLLDIARSLKTGTLVSVSGIAMARRSHLSERLLAVLDATRRRAAVTRKVAVAAWGGAACFVLPLAGAVPDDGEVVPTDSTRSSQSVAVRPIAPVRRWPAVRLVFP
jgi:bla regulator protein BlaR1